MARRLCLEDLMEGVYDSLFVGHDTKTRQGRKDLAHFLEQDGAVIDRRPGGARVPDAISLGHIRSVGLVFPAFLRSSLRSPSLMPPADAVSFQVSQPTARCTTVPLAPPFGDVGDEGDAADLAMADGQPARPGDLLEVLLIGREIGRPFRAPPARGVGQDDPDDQTSENRERHPRGSSQRLPRLPQGADYTSGPILLS